MQKGTSLASGPEISARRRSRFFLKKSNGRSRGGDNYNVKNSKSPSLGETNPFSIWCHVDLHLHLRKKEMSGGEGTPIKKRKTFLGGAALIPRKSR